MAWAWRCPAGVLGEGLAGWPGKGLAVARCRPRQGPCRGSRGFPRQGSCRGPGKGLVVALRSPRQGSCRGGVRFVPFALCGLGLGVVLLLLSFGLTLAHLPCLAQCGGARGSDCPCTVIGVQKVYPSFCTPTGAPGPGPHISATRCWARPKTVRGQVGRILPQ